jgi:hypothetical protein
VLPNANHYQMNVVKEGKKNASFGKLFNHKQLQAF